MVWVLTVATMDRNYIQLFLIISILWTSNYGFKGSVDFLNFVINMLCFIDGSVEQCFLSTVSRISSIIGIIGAKLSSPSSLGLARAGSILEQLGFLCQILFEFHLQLVYFSIFALSYYWIIKRKLPISTMYYANIIY